MTLLSHISAFEYWRIVGLPGVCVPELSFAQMPPLVYDGDDFDWLTGMGLLSRPVHVTVSGKVNNSRGRADGVGQAIIAHHRPNALPRGLIYKISGTQYVVAPELALAQIAKYVSPEELTCLASEFCGLYSPYDAVSSGMIRRDGLTTPRKLRSFCNRAKGIHGVGALKSTSKYCLARSRSPMETVAGELFSLPRSRGGYGLGGCVLNSKVRLDLAERKRARVEMLEPDILWPNERVVVEYDSDEFHMTPGRIANDARRKNALISSGYSVVTLTRAHMFDAAQMDTIAFQISRLRGVRLRGINSREFAQLQYCLRKELMDGRGVVREHWAVSRRAGQRW